MRRARSTRGRARRAGPAGGYRAGRPGSGSKLRPAVSDGESTVRTLPVVVVGVGPERPVEMPPTPDEGPVETLGPDGLDHPLRVGVRVRSPDRDADDPHHLRAQDRVERAAELRVPVADEESGRSGASVEPEREVPGLLGDPRRVGVHR